MSQTISANKTIFNGIRGIGHNAQTTPLFRRQKGVNKHLPRFCRVNPLRTYAAIALVVGAVFSASAVLLGAARAEDLETSPIGKVVTATGSVTIEHANAVVVQANIPASNGVGQAKTGDLVYRGDAVQTGADGKVGITFTDGSAFNLSANARMVLNEFVYDPNGKSNATLFSLSKGTFTFIAGKVAKTGDMKIDTPVATMGIRGTTPHVEISEDGTVKFSTLIEENKGRVTEKRGDIEENRRGVPVKQRQATRGSSTDSSSARRKQVENNPDRNFNINLKICRGC